MSGRLRYMASGHLARGPNGHLVKRCKCHPFCQANTTPDSVQVTLANLLFCAPCFRVTIGAVNTYWGRWNPAPSWTGGVYTLGPIDDCTWQDYYGCGGSIDYWRFLGSNPGDCAEEIEGIEPTGSHAVDSLVVRVGFVQAPSAPYHYWRHVQAWLALAGGAGGVNALVYSEDMGDAAFDCSEDSWGGANEYAVGDCGVTAGVGMYGGTVSVDANL